MQKNVNIKTLDVSLMNFFRIWMELLKPFHKLANKEIEIVSYLLYRRHMLKMRIDDDKLVDELLLNKATRDEIKKKMGYSNNQVLSNTLSQLRAKNIIVEGDKITKLLIPNMEKDSKNFKLLLNFNINEA